MNTNVWGVIDTASNVLSDVENVNKFNTHVQHSTNQEKNLESLHIEEESLRSIFPELGPKFDYSVRVNVENYVLSKIPNFKCIGHPPMETADIRNLDYISATRPKNCNGL